MEFDKEKAFAHIRSDITSLCEQSEENEIRSYVAGIRGQVRLLMNLSLISPEEAGVLEGEMGAARSEAAGRIG